MLALVLLSVAVVVSADKQEAAIPDHLLDSEILTDAPTTVNGSIPSWLDGYFFRQTCGAFGDTKAPTGSRITHLFDCLGAMSVYRFKDGKATFSNSYYHNRAYEIFKDHGMDLSASKVAWGTTFTETDPKAMAAYSNITGIGLNPNIDFWKVGKRMEAVTESTAGVQFDVHTLMNQQYFNFSDNDLTFPKSIFINNPAHEHIDQNGDLWSTTLMWRPTGDYHVFQAYRAIYKIASGTYTRQIEVLIPNSAIDTRQCIRDPSEASGWRYDAADLEKQELGYLHSITGSPNYIVIPTTSLVLNPCFLHPEAGAENYGKPFFKTWYKFDADLPATFLVYVKNKGESFRHVADRSYFFTHQINAYEDKDELHMDMLAYYDAGVYTKYSYVDYILDPSNTTPRVTQTCRYSIKQPSDLPKESVVCVPLQDDDLPLEFPQINYAYAGMDYRYAYILFNYWFSDGMVVKVDNKNPGLQNWKYFSPGDNIFPGEPVFVANPASTAEDDGIVIVGAVNANTNKGAIYILNAANMTQLAKIDAPVKTALGLHNRFYAASDFE